MGVEFTFEELKQLIRDIEEEYVAKSAKYPIGSVERAFNDGALCSLNNLMIAVIFKQYPVFKD